MIRVSIWEPKYSLSIALLKADAVKKEGDYGFFGTVTVTDAVAVLPEASVAE